MIVADDAFPLKEYILKPYSQVGLTREKRIFNYRLSCARRIVENGFGILANRFRIFMTPIALAPEKVETIVMACCSLHKILRSRCGACSIYTPQGSLDTEDLVRGDKIRIPTVGCHLSDKEAIDILMLPKRSVIYVITSIPLVQLHGKTT